MALGEIPLNVPPYPETPTRDKYLPPSTLSGSIWTTPAGNFPSYPASLSSTPAASYATTSYQRPSRAKRKVNENNLLPHAGSSARKKQKQHHSTPKPPERTEQEKLSLFFEFLKDVLGWSYGQLLFYTTKSVRRTSGAERTVDESISPSHAAYIQHFMHGRGGYCPAQILENWLKHPYGRGEASSPLMYSTTHPYTGIKPVRPALTSFAAQLIAKKLVTEAEIAVEMENGLHVSVSAKISANKTIQWPDVGSATFEHTREIIQRLQPVTWSLITNVAARPPRKRDNIMAVRQRRPPDIVSTGIISTLNFSIIETNSIRLDNVQNYHRQRDPGVGWENKLNIGLAATYFEVEGVDVAAFDLDDKQRRIAENQRKNLSTDKLLSFIDSAHLERVGTLQWINTLVQYIPQLGHLKAHVSLLYRTRAAKQRLDPKPTRAHPLASSSRNETILPDFKEAIHDFLAQIGQTPEKFKRQLVPAGGDLSPLANRHLSYV